VEHKQALIERLREALEETKAFCTDRGVDVRALLRSEGYHRIALMDDAVEQIIVNDDLKTRFLDLASNVDKLFKAILPDTRATDFAPERKLFVVLSEKIRALMPEVDISDVMGDVGRLLDESMAPVPYIIETSASYDLSKIDFEALKKMFERGRKRTEAEKLRRTIHTKLQKMVRLNRSRINYLEEFQRLIDEYNAGSRNVEELFKELLEFAQRLNDEEQRHMAENLSEEELTVFDMLVRPDLKLTKKEREEVKRVARELLETLKQEKLVLDWRKRQQSRAAVRVVIGEILDRLPVAYTRALFRQLCDAVYQHVYDSYWGPGRSVYAATV